MSLVEELQRDSLDAEVPVSGLLRKALVVARKLKLGPFRQWVELELQGYKDRDVPNYRVLKGKVVAFNPYNGYIPVVFENDPDFGEQLATHYATDAVGVLDDLVKDFSDGGNIVVEFSQKTQQLLMRDNIVFMRTELHLAKSDLVKILDAVRNTILEWSLKLEEDGIVGEGMSFSSQEKSLAIDKAQELQPPINVINIGKMENSTIQQASEDL